VPFRKHARRAVAAIGATAAFLLFCIAIVVLMIITHTAPG
jgi:hypothetical protein